MSKISNKQIKSLTHISNNMVTALIRQTNLKIPFKCKVLIIHFTMGGAW